jgi:hypothetical protein
MQAVGRVVEKDSIPGQRRYATIDICPAISSSAVRPGAAPSHQTAGALSSVPAFATSGGHIENRGDDLITVVTIEAG